MNIATISQMIQQPAKTAPKGTAKMEGFGSVMSAILSQASSTQSNNGSGTQLVFEQAKQLIQSKDLKGLFDLLDVDVSDIEKVLSSEEIHFQDVAEILNIDPKELIGTLQMLLNGTVEKITDLSENLWELVQAVEQRAPEIQRELIRSLKGDGLPIQNAVDVIKFIKTMEFILPKTDMTMKQEALTFSLKEVVTKLETSILQSEKTVTLPEFRPMVRVVEVKTDTVEGTTMNIERSVAKMETHSVALPTNRSSQGEALVKEFQAIMNRSAFGQAGGATKLLIKIYPENLGTVRIELVQKDGVLTARLLSSTALGKELLDSQSQQLRHAFAQQNLTVERLEISQALQDPTRHDKNQSFGQQFKQQQDQERQEQSEQDKPQDSFLDLLMEAEV
ncbi:flagellar hook-length control protein FliK [Chungangia koreensis]|uniref:Flagellar hook-length control protein FliK n=1 Tax=Chungangia koreensis TaxID=752657 RepID=A0ABV8X275_9LACT